MIANLVPVLSIQIVEISLLALLHPALVACCCRQVMAQTDTFRATSLFVLMHSGIVNGFQLLCHAHTVLEPYMGNAAFSILLAIVLIHLSFYVFVTLTVLFMDASLVCVKI